MSGTMTLNLQAYDPKQNAAPSHGGQPLTSSLRSSIRQLRNLLKEQKDITLDGESLDLSSTIAVARYACFHPPMTYADSSDLAAMHLSRTMATPLSA